MLKRCPYCRPRWTFGTRNKYFRRLIAAIFPPHEYPGGDGRGPFTDGMCPKAARRENEEMDRVELKKWRDRWRRWEVEADAGGNTIKKYWIRDYQAARRREMAGYFTAGI